MVLNVLLDVAHLKVGFVVRMVSPVHLVHADEINFDKKGGHVK